MRALAIVALLSGCVAAPDVGQISEAVGEVDSGYPSPWERALFMAANRARSDPSTVKGSMSTVYPATAPLVFHKDLGRSSRFHATNLETGKAPLMHPSPCTLKTDVGTSGCDGNPSCACTTGATCNNCNSCPDGTDPFVRIKYFYTPGGSGEVAAAGYQDPWGVMDGWVDEAAGADGHRMIVDGSGYGLVGFGHSSGTSGACWPTFDVGDFASAKPAPAKIASAAPKPYAGNAGTFRVYATWTDPAAGAPKDLAASVDGKCTTMQKELGDPTLNATYYADVTLAAGCHPVFIVGHDAGGMRWAYPTTTAFTIAVGGGTCNVEMAQPASDCDAGNPNGGPDGGAGGSGGSGGAGGTGGAGGGDGTGGSGGVGGGDGSGGGGTGGSGGGAADNPGTGGGTHGAFGCAMALTSTPRGRGLLFALCYVAVLGGVVIRRRSRRGR
ncbi:MAG TPA: hypothetical protein VN947_17830 [Polyangia bacterium]|nr:hypothetical protein [Polyangia bacterium]